MTSRESLEVTEMKIRLHAERGGYCQTCMKPVSVEQTQLAHRVPKTKGNLKKYGKQIIHHELNLAITCSLECNAAVLIHGLPEDDLIARIRFELTEGI